MSTTAPKWIQEIEQVKDTAQAKTQADLRNRFSAAMTIGANGGTFWRELVAELENSVPHLARIGAHGSAALLVHDSSSCAPPTQEHCHIELTSRGTFPHITNMNLYYTNGDCQIKCYPLEGNAFGLDLVLHLDGNIGVSATNNRCWTPQETAEWLLRRMLEQIGIEQN